MFNESSFLLYETASSSSSHIALLDINNNNPFLSSTSAKHYHHQHPHQHLHHQQQQQLQVVPTSFARNNNNNNVKANSFLPILPVDDLFEVSTPVWSEELLQQAAIQSNNSSSLYYSQVPTTSAPTTITQPLPLASMHSTPSPTPPIPPSPTKRPSSSLSSSSYSKASSSSSSSRRSSSSALSHTSKRLKCEDTKKSVLLCERCTFKNETPTHHEMTKSRECKLHTLVNKFGVEYKFNGTKQKYNRLNCVNELKFSYLPRELKGTAEAMVARKESWVYGNTDTLLIPNEPAWSNIRARVCGHHVVVSGNAMLRLDGKTAFATPPFRVKVGSMVVSIHKAEHSSVAGGAFDVTYTSKHGVKREMTRISSNWFAVTVGSKSFDEGEDVRGISRQQFLVQKIANLTLSEELNNIFQISDLGSKHKTEVLLEASNPDSKFLFPFDSRFTISPINTSTSSHHKLPHIQQLYQYYYCSLCPPGEQNESKTSTDNGEVEDALKQSVDQYLVGL